MEFIKISLDVWRIVCQYLDKRDLQCLQLTDNRFITILKKIPDVWWGKHNKEYFQRWNEYYNKLPKTNRDECLEKTLLQKNPNKKLTRGCSHWEDVNANIKRTLFEKAGIVHPTHYNNRWHSQGMCMDCISYRYRGYDVY